MSDAFRELLKKVGSGTHTSRPLRRDEAAAATRMMLLQEATPAQIGAFMIAHRIKRPTAEELAGILEAYGELGPALTPIEAAYPTLSLGIPYDGRSRTAPLSPVTALMLVHLGCPVVMHGGTRMPTKYGVPLVALWQGLGVDWTGLSLAQCQSLFEQTLLGFVYLPNHFVAAQTLVPYREQIGKRPPFATAELMWSPYRGAQRRVVGYVHPPTAALAQQTFALLGVDDFVTVKGLEGSVDLPCDRTAIIGIHSAQSGPSQHLIHARDYGLGGPEVPWTDIETWSQGILATLQGEPTAWQPACLWNGGFYLWQAGICDSLTAGLSTAKALLSSGELLKTLNCLAEKTRQPISVLD